MTEEIEKRGILIAGPHGFLGKYVMREFSDHFGRKSIVTLGINADNDIVCDLTESAVELPSSIDTVIDCVGACFGRDCISLNIKATQNLLKSLEAVPPKHFVYFSSVEVFGMTEGEEIDENYPRRSSTETGLSKIKAEEILKEWCDKHNTLLTIFYCPHIIGTGMKGYPRRLVNGIYRGFYTHIAGSEARVSVVHATDVAKAALTVYAIGGCYIITDGVNPTRHDLAEALAYRIDNKRIFTISEKKARRTARLLDFFTFSRNRRDNLRQQLSTLTFSSKKLREKCGFNPVSVTEYLRNHVYDEQSL